MQVAIAEFRCGGFLWHSVPAVHSGAMRSTVRSEQCGKSCAEYHCLVCDVHHTASVHLHSTLRASGWLLQHATSIFKPRHSARGSVEELSLLLRDTHTSEREGCISTAAAHSPTGHVHGGGIDNARLPISPRSRREISQQTFPGRGWHTQGIWLQL